MKTITIFIFSFLLYGVQLIKADENNTGLKDGAIWCYCNFTEWREVDPYYRYILDGDTVINHRTYKKMYRYITETYKRETAEYMNALRKQDSIIYCTAQATHDEGDTFYLPVADGEIVLYDFTKKQGETVGENSPQASIVNFTNVMELGGIPRVIVDFGKDKSWIEDLGILTSDFFNPLDITSSHHVWLDMYIEDGKVIYGAPEFSFVTEGNRWTERVTQMENKSDYRLNTYYIGGDTLIAGKTYKKLYENKGYKGALRVNIEHKVFYYEEGKPEILLYDFHWKMPKRFHFTNYQGREFEFPADNRVYADLSEMKLADGKTHQYCNITENPNPDGAPFKTLNDSVKLIQNIGLTAGIFKMAEVGKESPSCYTDLVSFYNAENKLIYKNPYFSEEGELTSIDVPKADQLLSIYQEGKQIVFAFSSLAEKDGMLHLYRIDGRKICMYSMQDGILTVSNLEKGVYLYRLETGTAKTETGKFIVKH